MKRNTVMAPHTNSGNHFAIHLKIAITLLINKLQYIYKIQFLENHCIRMEKSPVSNSCHFTKVEALG